MADVELSGTAADNKPAGLYLVSVRKEAAAPVVLGSAAKPKRKTKKAIRRPTGGRGISQTRVSVDDFKGFIEDTSIESLAREGGSTPLKVVEGLPSSMRRFAPSSAFVKVMNDIALWGSVTVMLGRSEGVVEMTGHLPRGEEAHGYFYWIGGGPIRGRLRPSLCGSIAFDERPFMGRASASILFFNADGDIMLKVLLARDPDQATQALQLKAMRKLAQRVCPVE